MLWRHEFSSLNCLDNYAMIVAYLALNWYKQEYLLQSDDQKIQHIFRWRTCQQCQHKQGTWGENNNEETLQCPARDQRCSYPSAPAPLTFQQANSSFPLSSSLSYPCHYWNLNLHDEHFLFSSFYGYYPSSWNPHSLVSLAMMMMMMLHYWWHSSCLVSASWLPWSLYYY